MNFYEAYHFLNEHNMFKGRFWESLYVEIVKVDPETNCVERDTTRNTKTQVWLEAGPYIKAERCSFHDMDLDCGGDTFEEAIIELAELVRKKYGRTRLKDKRALIRVVPILVD